MLTNQYRANLVILSGPSGVGKDSVSGEICRILPNTTLSISCTTRPPRYKSDGCLEQDGIDYFFIDRTQFPAHRFLESTSYLGEWYGTSIDHIKKLVQDGYKHIVLNLDDKGVAQVKTITDALSILLLPPSAHELKRRLTHRNSENSTQINKRMQKSYAQIKSMNLDHYDYVIINDIVSNTSECVIKIINCIYPKQSYSDKKALIDHICATFSELETHVLD